MTLAPFCYECGRVGLKCRCKGGTLDNNAPSDAKPERGKPPVSLVPGKAIRAIASAMEAGNRVNGYSPGSWRGVDPAKFWDALGRHFTECLDDPQAIDAETGEAHMALLGANLAFLLALGFHEGGS